MECAGEGEEAQAFSSVATGLFTVCFTGLVEDGLGWTQAYPVQQLTSGAGSCKALRSPTPTVWKKGVPSPNGCRSKGHGLGARL